MESNIHLFHASENRTMAFCGAVKPERWNRLLNPVDDMTRFAISRALGEGVFDYQYTWRTNSDIIGSFIGCLVRAKVDANDIISLCRNLFVPTWRKGLEQAVFSIDGKFRIPLPERYMSLPVGHPDLITAPRRQSLFIRENFAFYKEWPKMEASLHFLLRWRGIIIEENKDWLLSYLHRFNAYVKPGVSFDNLEDLVFITPNTEKSSREKHDYIFPPNYQVEHPNDMADVIMVFWKDGRGPA